MNYEDLFTCEKCGNILVAGIIQIVEDKVKCKCACKKGHKKIIELPMKDKINWIVPLTAHIYKCLCGNEVTDLKMNTSGDKTDLVLYCEKHKNRKRKIDTILWNDISNARSKILESQVVVEEEFEVPPPPPPPTSLEQVNRPEVPTNNESSVNTIGIPEDEKTEKDQTAFCPVCGQVLPEGATKFCPSCGSEL
ncbi:MAG: hypothetical protein GF329_07980 [Candidatus Lokiarchaeota archaeon]|nr:hypothetical protein [Candidatus Lokiarchaeota archaeon]